MSSAQLPRYSEPFVVCSIVVDAYIVLGIRVLCAGVEIRNDLCLTAVDEYVGLETDNLYFLGCNFVQSAGAILSALPTSIHKLVSGQAVVP